MRPVGRRDDNHAVSVSESLQRRETGAGRAVRFAVVHHRFRKAATNSPNGIQPGSAPGNWSVVNRPALYKPHPENILFDIRRLQRRSSRARRSLISLQVLAAARECAGDPDSVRVRWRTCFPMAPMLSVPLRPMTSAGASMRRQAGGVEVFLGSAVGWRFLHATSRARLPRSGTFRSRRSPLQARRMRLCRYRVASWPEKMRKRKAARSRSMSAG